MYLSSSIWAVLPKKKTISMFYLGFHLSVPYWHPSEYIKKLKREVRHLSNSLNSNQILSLNLTTLIFSLDFRILLALIISISLEILTMSSIFDFHRLLFLLCLHSLLHRYFSIKFALTASRVMDMKNEFITVNSAH